MHWKSGCTAAPVIKWDQICFVWFGLVLLFKKKFLTHSKISCVQSNLSNFPYFTTSETFTFVLSRKKSSKSYFLTYKKPHLTIVKIILLDRDVNAKIFQTVLSAENLLVIYIINIFIWWKKCHWTKKHMVPLDLGVALPD